MGGFLASLIIPELIKGVVGGIFKGQVNTTYVTPDGVPQVDTKHWVWSKTIWGGLGVLGYVGVSIFTGNSLNIADVNSIISNGGNIFLTLSAILGIVGRFKV